MKKRELRGSLTVEAAGVMAVVLLSLGTMLQAAGWLHDETKGAMILHEMTEKYRHEKELLAEEARQDLRDRGDFWMTFSDYGIELEEKGKRLEGRGRGGKWEKRISAEAFRPETFLRKITLIEGLGEKDEG